jgi:hypothetical protein
MNNKIEKLQQDLKEAMIEGRSQNALIEKAQVRLMMEYVEKERKSFEYADTSQFILQDKNEVDLILLMNQIVDWNGKAKPENKQVLTNMFLAILRVQNYVQTLETLNKHTVSKYVIEVENNKNSASYYASNKLQSEKEIRDLKKEIDVLKKEVEFLSK